LPCFFQKMNRNSNKLFLLGICLVLTFSTLAVYWQVLGNGFCFDDGKYITSNEHVSTGLTWENFKWAFTSGYASNWHPLTWLSHMLDCQVFKLNPGPHHLINVLFHLANTVLLFLFLNRTTRTLWRAAFVAGLFALHPLHVESVAWISERKDVLSTFFGFLMMWAYARYADKPRPKNYMLVILLFALGLMAKPMLVTMPFVLLLMDYWPLDRLMLKVDYDNTSKDLMSRKKIILRLICEKIPMLVLVFASSVVTYLVQKEGDAVRNWPFTSRLANAAAAYSAYITKLFWPAKLAVYYPHPYSIPIWHLLFSAFFLLGVSLWALRCWRTKPWFLAGWLWYLGILFPVIGLVQVGGQAMADRYTYVPLIGLFIIVIWAFEIILMKTGFQKIVSAVVMVVIFAGLSISSWKQIGYWRDNITLFEHTLKVAAPSTLVCDSLGIEYMQLGQLDKAIEYHNAAIKLTPQYFIPYYNMAIALQKKGKIEEAIMYLKKAMELKSSDPKIYSTLASFYYDKGQFDEAIENLTIAVKLKPDRPDLQDSLALAFYKKGNIDKAVEHWKKALQLKPGWTEVQENLDKMQQQKKRDEIIAQYLEKVRQNPDDFDTHNKLAVFFFYQGQIEKAIDHWTKALQIKDEWPEAHYYLGGAFYKQGDIDKAVAHWKRALQLKPGWTEVQENLDKLLQQKKRDETVAQYLEKVRQNPDDIDTYNKLAAFFYQQGEIEKAVEYWAQVVRIDPDMPEAHSNLATAYCRQNKLEQAIEHWTKASELKPDWPEVYNNLAWTLATAKDDKVCNPKKAVQFAQKACELTEYKRPDMLDTLGVAYAADGRFSDATETAEKALKLAVTANQVNVAEEIRTHLGFYKAKKPYKN
jgi:protein O-mannosyl-transferase